MRKIRNISEHNNFQRFSSDTDSDTDLSGGEIELVPTQDDTFQNQ